MADVARVAFAAALGAVGVAHFVSPRIFVAHLPPQVPERAALVYATGALEIALAGAVALGPSRSRTRIGQIIAAYLVLVFPANVYVAAAGVPVYPEAWQAWARLPLQPLFVWWILHSTSTRADARGLSHGRGDKRR